MLVLTASGLPQKDVNISFTHLQLTIGGPYGSDDPDAEGKWRDFTDGELRELFSKHKVTIRWSLFSLSSQCLIQAFLCRRKARPHLQASR